MGAESRGLKVACRSEQAKLFEGYQKGLRVVQCIVREVHAEASFLRQAKAEFEGKNREFNCELAALQRRELAVVIEMEGLKERLGTFNGRLSDTEQNMASVREEKSAFRGSSAKSTRRVGSCEAR